MSTRGEVLRIGTRGSALARYQATRVKERLETRRRSVELVEVETTGDELDDERIHRLGTTGAFVRALDEQVLAGDLDAAVHSMKDMPTDQPAELVVAGVLPRGAAGDALVTPDETSLEALPDGATVGTASLRRRAQLLNERPDLTIAGLRGNVDTRVEKLLAPTLQDEHQRRREAEKEDDEGTDAGDNTNNNQNDGDKGENGDGSGADESEGAESVEAWVEGLSAIERAALDRDVETEYDAICLAQAGLERMDLIAELTIERLDPTRIVPAPSQGIIAVTARDGEVASAIQSVIDHPPTRVEATVERTILNELGGGCVAPVGIHARLQGDVVTTTARILSQVGTDEVQGIRELPVADHASAAREFAQSLAEDGAADLVEEAKRAQPDDPKRE